MNPFSRYDHKAQLFSSVLVAVAAIYAIRTYGWRSIAALGTLAWSAIGIVDWAIYTFGYTIAGWSVRDTDAIGGTLAWIQLPIAAIAVVGFLLHVWSRED